MFGNVLIINKRRAKWGENLQQTKGIKENIITTKANPIQCKNINTFHISFECKKAYKIIKHLYQDAETYLERKNKTAQQIIIDFADKYDKD